MCQGSCNCILFFIEIHKDSYYFVLCKKLDNIFSPSSHMLSPCLSTTLVWKIKDFVKAFTYLIQTFRWYCYHRSVHWPTHQKELPRTCHSDFGTGLFCPHVWLGRSECDSAQRYHIYCGFPAGWSWFLCPHGTTLRWCLSAKLAPMNSILNMYLLDCCH